MVSYIPKKGDFISLTFDPQAGHEQKGTRPGLVVSHTVFNKRMGFVFVCPITNTQRKNAFHIPVASRKLTGIYYDRTAQIARLSGEKSQIY